MRVLAISDQIHDCCIPCAEQVARDVELIVSAATSRAIISNTSFPRLTCRCIYVMGNHGAPRW